MKISPFSIGNLGGGNSNIFEIFIPKLGEDEANLTSIFLKWVAQPLVKLTQTMTWVFPLPSNSINDYFIFRLGDSYNLHLPLLPGKGDNPNYGTISLIYILFCALHDFEFPALLIKKVPMNPFRIFVDKPKNPHQQKGVLP